MSKNKSPRSHLMTFLALAAAQALLALPAFAQEVHHFDVQAANVPAAVHTLGEQSGVQIFASADTLMGKQLNSVTGDMTTDAAFQTFLAGTGLSAKYVGDRAVALVSNNSGAGAAVQPSSSGVRNGAEAAGNSTGGILIAQAQGTPPAKAPSKDQQATAAPKKSEAKSEQLEEVVVTGSRLPTAAGEGAQAVQVYSKQQIEQSGQTSVSEFLNSLPNVSVATTESGTQVPYGSTTVRLRGLPIGTTLILLNGRRVQTSGPQAAANIFDLNNIPLAAVDRIEVIADGSSAVYGSDAIAGVVNIILKQKFDGFEASVKYGGASGIGESNTSLAWGDHWEKGSVSVVGSYQARGELDNTERALTRSNDYTALGGRNANFPVCNPGNVFSADGVTPLPGLGSATYAAVPVGFTGTPTVAEFANTAGALNKCGFLSGSSIIPETRRAGVFAQAAYNATPSLELFTELMYSHVEEFAHANYPNLFGVPGFQLFKVPASNPYNPFGTTVGVSDVFTNVPRLGAFLDTKFIRALIGARGDLPGSWRWEISAWDSEDHTDNPQPLAIPNFGLIQGALNSSDPATALNPFVSGAAGQASLIRSFYTDGFVSFVGRQRGLNGFARGPLFQLPSGPIEVVVGSEYDRDSLSSDAVNDGVDPPNTRTENHRNSYALFVEARIPILAKREGSQVGNVLAVTLAGRRDKYSDFGTRNTPQIGAEWRPSDTLLVRATYAEAFKAPSLFDLYSPQQSFQGIVSDPLTGNSNSLITEVTGGNPNLRAEKGESHTFGFVYSSAAIPNLRLSVTSWSVVESDSINGGLSAQSIVDNEAYFPGDVVRAPGSNGQPGPITTVLSTELNFGTIRVSGIDYGLNYRHDSAFGAWTPSLAVTQTYRYESSLVPGSPAIDGVGVAQSTASWAPRWKGAVGLGWSKGPFVAQLTGRYTSRYFDYGSTTREIGNFWLWDTNVRYDIRKIGAAEGRFPHGAFIEVGGVNVFNRPPQFSNFKNAFVGYDPAQADIRGRFLYARLGVKF